MIKEVDVFDYMNDIMKALQSGVLLTTKYEDKVDSMSISWGQIGIEWNRPIFTTFVRTGRFTHELLGKNPEFTVNFPQNNNSINKCIGFCGTKSGRDTDKHSALGLDLVDSPNVNVPGIRQLPLTLECKVIYRQMQDKESIPQEFKKDFYPQDVPSDFYAANRDYHEMFFGEIVGAYIAE